jgi:hypothetical protein
MRVYGLDYAETRSACEHCGFSCFDDELWCPNCNKERESLLSKDADERKRQLTEYDHKYGLLKRASKRGWRLLAVFLGLNILTCLLAGGFFSTVQTYSTFYRAMWMMPVKILVLIMLIYLFLLGQPGLQCSRSKDERPAPSWFAKGLLRHFQDGRIAELFYVVVLFFIICALSTFWAEAELATYYYRLKVTVSEELYGLVCLGSLYVVNFIWFAWYFLCNFLCPYDYRSELNMRLQKWRK